jgi:hypothetical protein
VGRQDEKAGLKSRIRRQQQGVQEGEEEGEEAGGQSVLRYITFM